MFKAGKSLFPAAAQLARPSAAGQMSGRVASSVVRLADGRALQMTALQGVSRRSVSSSSLSTTPLHVAAGEAPSLSKSLVSRHVTTGPALPARGDSKQSEAAQRPFIDVTPLPAEGTANEAGEAGDFLRDFLGNELSVDELHAQMYEHESAPTQGAGPPAEPADGEAARQWAKADAFMQEVAAQIDAADPREQLVAARFFETTPDAGLPGEGVGDRDRKSADSLETAGTIDPGSTEWQQVLRKSLPPGSAIVCVHDANELNEKAVRKGERPQWKPHTKVVAVQLAPYTPMFQAVTDQGGEASQLAGLKKGLKYFGSWFLMARPSDATETRQLAAILKAWKQDISHVALVYNRESIEILVGVAGPMAQGAGEPDLPGGAAQARCPDEDKEHLFMGGVFDLFRETSAATK